MGEFEEKILFESNRVDRIAKQLTGVVTRLQKENDVPEHIQIGLIEALARVDSLEKMLNEYYFRISREQREHSQKEEQKEGGE